MPSVEPPTAGLTGREEQRRDDRVGRASGFVTLISAAVLVLVAVALALAAFVVQQNGSDMEAKAGRIARATKQHVAVTGNASRDLGALHATAEHTYTALGGLMAAYRAQLASQNHAIDAANGAAAAYNSGQANIADALKPGAEAALADAEAKSAAVRAALVQVEQAFAALRRASG